MVRLVPSRCGACRRAHSLSPVPTLSVSTLARSDRHRTPPPSRLRCPRPSPPRHPRPACGRGRADCILAHQARRAKAHAERRENQLDSRRRGAWHARWRARRWVQNKRHTHLFVGIVLVVCNRRVIVSRRRVGPPLATDNWQVKIELAHHFELTKKKVGHAKRERDRGMLGKCARSGGKKASAPSRAGAFSGRALCLFAALTHLLLIGGLQRGERRIFIKGGGRAKPCGVGDGRQECRRERERSATTEWHRRAARLNWRVDKFLPGGRVLGEEAAAGAVRYLGRRAAV